MTAAAPFGYHPVPMRRDVGRSCWVVVVAVAAAVGAVGCRDGGCQRSEPRTEAASAESWSQLQQDEGRDAAKRPLREEAGEWGTRPGVLGLIDRGAVRPASGPLRFVVRHGAAAQRREDARARSEAQAREQAEAFRSRVLAGEDPVPLIRELSDPPIGLPAALVARYESLGPGEASPVERLADGFAVFFGRAPEPPSPAAASTDAGGDGGDGGPSEQP